MENGQFGKVSKEESDAHFQALNESINTSGLDMPEIPREEYNPLQENLDIANSNLNSGVIDDPNLKLKQLNLSLNTTVHKDDPVNASRPVLFKSDDPDHQNQFYNRYRKHADFDQHGFSPFRDNESLYNSTTNFFNEIGRASENYRSLVGIAMADMIGLSGMTNQDFARKFELLNAEASSSVGGVTGFASNLYLNSACCEWRGSIACAQAKASQKP